ncbi:MAG TPA: Hsp33 family molecular chaperone HslO, partial [Thermoanaerobaculia bacterium]
GGAEQVLATLFAGLDREVVESRPLRYRCRCSRERLQRHLALLAADDRDHLRDERGEIVAECAFCAAQYRFLPEELNGGGEG